jgi:ParB family chromosome partitioning protein
MAKSSLGRGLGAIFDEVEEAYQKDLAGHQKNIINLDIEDIKPNPYQPRKYFDNEALKELSDSIKEHGLLQPIIVTLDNDNYIIVAGERRYRATKLAGINSINAIVADVNIKKLRELAIIENIQREELNPIELALSYKELINDYEITHEELSNRVKKSRTNITNIMRLLNLDKFVQDRLIKGDISIGHAKLLVPLDVDMQKQVTESIIGQKLSVRDTEDLLKNLKEDKEETNCIKKVQYDVDILKSSLKNAFFKSKFSGNKLVIELGSEEEIAKLAKFFEKNL